MAELQPIGVIKNDSAPWDAPHPIYLPARVIIKPELEPALTGLELNSHIWLLCLFQHRRPPSLKTTPKHIDPHAPSFGTLALRSPNHPNPIALTLVQLQRREGNVLFIDQCDAYDGTPVLDIKPYYERDCVFSPRMPGIRHHDLLQRQAHLLHLGRNHHQEDCPGLALAVQMALLVEQHFACGIQSHSLILSPGGDACLADCLQGISRARLARPARFHYQPQEPAGCLWQSAGRRLHLLVKPQQLNFTEILASPAASLFSISED